MTDENDLSPALDMLPILMYFDKNILAEVSFQRDLLFKKCSLTYNQLYATKWILVNKTH